MDERCFHAVFAGHGCHEMLWHATTSFVGTDLSSVEEVTIADDGGRCIVRFNTGRLMQIRVFEAAGEWHATHELL